MILLPLRRQMDLVLINVTNMRSQIKRRIYFHSLSTPSTLWTLFQKSLTSITNRPLVERGILPWKTIILMTSSMLSLTMMSGLKSFHKSRLQSKQRLAKKTKRKTCSHNRSRQHVIPCLLVGWFWGNRIWLGRPYCGSGASQTASQPVSWHTPDQFSWSSSHAWDVGSLFPAWFGMFLWYDKEKCITTKKKKKNVGWT